MNKLKVSSELTFSNKGRFSSLDRSVVDEFLALARKIQSVYDQHQTVEIFKESISHASGQACHRSSSLSWAETDLENIAMQAGENPVEFVVGFCNGCLELKNAGSEVPAYEYLNALLTSHKLPFRISDDALVPTAEYVPSPSPPPKATETLKLAISNARTLIEKEGAGSAVDRLHTALHAYLKELCLERSISYDPDDTVSKILKSLRNEHPAFVASGHRGDDIQKVILSMGSTVDALTTLRNNASLAHANVLLEEPEALAVVNATATVFQYLQDRIARFENTA